MVDSNVDELLSPFIPSLRCIVNTKSNYETRIVVSMILALPPEKCSFIERRRLRRNDGLSVRRNEYD